MTGKILVQHVSETTQFDPRGNGQPVIRVQFTVDDHGPFFESIAKADYNPTTLRAKLQEFANGLNVVTGY